MHIIVPNEGTTLIRFGMSPEQVETHLGAPISVRRHLKSEQREYRDETKVTYSLEGEARELVFGPPGIVLFDGHNLLEGNNQIEILRAYDDEPMSYFQFVMFLNIGVSVSGFHNGDRNQESISIFTKDLFDSKTDLMEPYQAGEM